MADRREQQEQQRAQLRARRDHVVTEPIAAVDTLSNLDKANAFIKAVDSSSKEWLESKLAQMKNRIAMAIAGNVQEPLDFLDFMNKEIVHVTEVREAAMELYKGWIAEVHGSTLVKIEIQKREKLVWEAIHSIILLLPDLPMPLSEDGIEAMLLALAYAPGGKHFQEAEVRFNGKRKAE
jgi:predicted metal-dependent hydrolase